MLSKAHRLTEKDIQYIFKKGKRLRTAAFLFVYRPATRGQFGVSVRKKDIAQAVDRNRIRRRCYGAMRSLDLQKLPVRALCLYNPKPGGHTAAELAQSFAQFRAAMTQK